MATYIAHNQSRDIITVTLSKAEADAISTLAEIAQNEDFEGFNRMSPASKKAANRAIDALIAATNTSARRAGFFDT